MVSSRKIFPFLSLTGVALLVFLFLPACSLLAPPAADSVAIAGYSAAPHPDNALRIDIALTLSRAAPVLIEYENEYAGQFRTPLTPPAAIHSIPLLRLRAETTYRYRIGLAGPGGDLDFAAEGKFTTGSLPEDLATMQTTVTGRSSQPLLRADYSVTFPDRTTRRYIVARDDRGQIVWYYADHPAGPLAPGDTGSIQVGQRRPNGNLLYIIRNCCIREITPLGERVAELAAGDNDGIPHHDLLIQEDGRILYLSDSTAVFDDSANGGAADTAAVFDELRLYDPALGRSELVWSAREAWDIADPDQRVVWDPNRLRWTHANSMALGPHGNLIISLRNRNQVIALRPDFQSIAWQLNGPDSDYAFPNPADRFYRQHTATQLPNGNILVFDNGLARPAAEGGQYSRALELRLDDESKTAVQVWEYRPDPELYARFISSAYRLANGNTLVNFGAVQSWADLPLTVVEVDAAGKEVFRMETIDPPLAERAQTGPRRARIRGGIPSLNGETQLRPTKAMPP